MKRGKSIKYVDLLLEEMERNKLPNDDESEEQKEAANSAQVNKITEYIKTHPNLDDTDFHKFAMSIGLEPFEAEEVVYGLAHDLLTGKQYVTNHDGMVRGEKFYELDEMMSTATAAGAEEYATPSMFSKNGETSDKIKKISTMFGMKPVEKTNRWFKKTDNEGHIINENLDISVNTSLYKRMMKSVNGDI